MGLPEGIRLGPYQVGPPIGAGGMGEVYRAHDTRLDRTVAIKILPTHVSDPELKQRFEREARAISALNHPRICTLYDVGSQDGISYLVMEYLDGRTLAEEIAKGPLPIERALNVAIQIAEALEAAHGQAIVHRDLKPGNVMLSRSSAKLMDFGLAKPIASLQMTGPLPAMPAVAPGIGNLTMPATALTQKGTLIGTFHYMAPEVLQGQEADERADVFSFGCLLYEMLSGKHAFPGKSQVNVVAAILEKEPEPLSITRSGLAPRIEEVLRHCLAKNREDRFGCAHDLRLALQDVSAVRQENRVIAKRSSAIAWVVAACAVVIAVLLTAFYWSVVNAPKSVVRSYLLPPPGTTLEMMSTGSGPPVFSPDGRQLAFTARDDKGKVMLYIRSLDEVAAKPIEGTDQAHYPFWSPDGKQIAFFASGKLKSISVYGGPARVLCPAENGRGGAWSDKNVIVFTPGVADSLLKVPAGGGTPDPASKLAEGQNSHRWPYFLPDGEHYLYWSRSSRAVQENALYVGSLNSDDPKLLFKGDSMAQYVSGYLLFVRDQTLMALRFDPRTLKLSGDPIPLAQHVAINAGVNRPIFSASNDGKLLYASGDSSGGWRLLWYDRDGKQTGQVGTVDRYYDATLSPEGKRVATAIFSDQGSSDVWVLDLVRGTRTRVTFGTSVHVGPIWSRDGNSIYYSSNLKGNQHIYATAADGSGTELTILEDPDYADFPGSITPDQRFLLCTRRALREPDAKWAADIWALPLFGDRKPVPLVQTPFTESTPRISPDGKWIAYMNDESGRMEIYLTRFPASSGKWQVSTAGGFMPKWRKDGKELFFVDEALDLVAVDVDTSQGTIKLGTPHTLFHTAGMQMQNGPYEVSADGKTFLINSADLSAGNEPLTLVQNWTAELKK